MLNLRAPIVLVAAPAGVVLASLAWFATDGPGTAIRPLDRLDARLSVSRSETPRTILDAGHSLSEAIAAPLFVLSAGPGAATDPSVRLDGIAISPRSSMALLSVNGQPSSWTALGASRDGFTLTEVHPDRVVIDTPVAFKEITLWSTSGGSQTLASGTPAGAVPPPPGSPALQPVDSPRKPQAPSSTAPTR